MLQVNQLKDWYSNGAFESWVQNVAVVFVPYEPHQEGVFSPGDAAFDRAQPLRTGVADDA